MSKVVELYGVGTGEQVDWARVVKSARCPFLERTCLKSRKSSPRITIGTCTIATGRDRDAVMICPFRLLERRQVFTDCLHLLTLHQPGNELHIVPELNVPGGSIDYCLVSARAGRVIDFVGIELQTLDSTGTVWPERQRFLHEHGLTVRRADRESRKPFGLNWKMTAKTALMQLHHKIKTFQHVSKHLVLVLQDHLLDYMKREFSFGHLEQPRVGDPMHFHSYALLKQDSEIARLQLTERLSTDTAGVARCLGLQGEASLALDDILDQLQAKITPQTLMSLEQPLPAASLIHAAMSGDG